MTAPDPNPGGEPQAAVIGGGVVGCAVLHALTRRGIEAALLEAEDELACGASGANSGILHTGFDSQPGELETRLILRANELRARIEPELGVEVRRCGALLAPRGDEERAAVARLADNARTNGVDAHVDAQGTLHVPGEAITDPVAYVYALADAATAGGGRLELGARVTGLARHTRGGIAVEREEGEPLRARAVINCGGLFADEIAGMAGEHPVSVYPRKGEFLVFAPPEPLAHILLPVPSALGKGVLVFPTLDGMLVTGPTAREREDKRDRSVEGDARELIMARAVPMYPPLARIAEVAAYTGLRPAGRDASYVIEPSRTLPGLVHAAAIRSTGLSAALAIGEHVVELLAASGVLEPGPERALPAPARPPAGEPWWRRAARHSAPAGEARR